MDGKMETTFNLLRAWDFTNLYEKSYFIFVHFVLLLLGIYSIKSRLFGSKARVRPSSPPGQHFNNDQVNGKPAVNHESSCRPEREIKWATETASWLLKDSYANDAVTTWKSKMNARLLQNMAKGKVQIDYLNKDDIKFNVYKIRSYKPEIKEQMNIIVYLHIEELELKVTHTNEDGKSNLSNLILHSLSPLLHIQLVGFNGKVRTYLKLSWMNLDDICIELDNEEINMEMVKESFRRSLQDTITLEATRGILKKEIKTEAKVNENSSQVDENHFEEDSKKHILVTDLDSAIAKVSSNSTQSAENSMAKECDNTQLKLKIPLPIKPPEINVLPATPISTDPNSDGIFSVENQRPAVEEMPLSSQKESESNEQSLEGDYSEENVAEKDLSASGNDEKLPKVKLNADHCEESIGMKEELQMQDKSSMELEDNRESKGVDSECICKEGNENDRTEDVTESNDKAVKDANEENPCEDSWNDTLDTSSESSKESWSLFKERKRARPISASEMTFANHGGMDLNFDAAMHLFENGSKKNAEAVNTFHLGSKSMVSIATTPKRSDSTPLRATSSQLSLVSPVGYSPSKPSALIIETEEQGKKRHYHVPPAVARKGTYEHHGVKLHVYNGHIFVAQHFSKPLPLCVVCNLPLGRRIGKQGYQCRDCKAVTHKRCHNLIGSCAETSLPSLKIEYPWSTDV